MTRNTPQWAGKPVRRHVRALPGGSPDNPRHAGTAVFYFM